VNLIRKLRSHAGLTQQELASTAGTSQSAIAAYESGAKSPTLRTVESLAASLDLEMVAEFAPRMTREDRRSLAYHRAVAALIEQSPEPIISRAHRNLTRLHEAHPHAQTLFDRWREWLALPPAQLIGQMLDAGPVNRDMRQVSPFSGVLSARKRAQILRRFRQEDSA
jgi:transcriptional regulator with XRE-family HTH domain